MARHKGALRLANDLRDEFRERGEFNQADYRHALAHALRPFEGEAYEGFVDHIAEQVDKSATRERSNDQPLLSPDWDLDGEYRLGSGRRVAKPLAHLEHMEEMMANDERNTAAVMQASARKREELARLRPYFLP